MKFIKLDLLTLLISLFLFASCENTSTIGLEIDRSNAVEGSLVDTVTIGSRTVEEDPVQTNFATRYPLGYLNDPIFGTTEAGLAMSVGLPSSSVYDFGTTPVVDSAVLVLNYGTEFYGDSTSTYSFDVHQLDFNLARETNFISSRAYSYFPALIGSKTGKLYPTTTYKVTDVVAGKADTLRTVSPQIRIRLDNSFVQSNIVNTSTSNLSNNINFTRSLGGLRIVVNKSKSNGNGGIAFFNLSDANSGIAIYYKKQNSTSGGIDTVAINFPIAATTATPIAATIKHDYPETIATQLRNKTVQYPITYLQPLAGLRNKITFPYLSKFATNIGKIAINKAELVIDLSSGTDIIPYNGAPRLSLYRYDIAERRQNLPDNNVATQYNAGDPRALGSAVFGGYYNAVTKQYIFVITSYIQDLLDGKTQDYGTFLAPTPLTEFDIYPSVSTAARSVIASFNKSAGTSGNTMKLNIYYTKIN